MLNTLTLGRYCPGTSLLHRSDPRTKLLLLLLVMVAVYAVRSCPALLVLLVIVFGIGGGVGKPLRQALRGLKPILGLGGVVVMVNLVSIPGTPVLDWAILHHVSQEALIISTKLMLRLVILAFAATLLILTTTPFALAQGLESLLKPLGRLGVPTAEMTMILLLALRFIPIIAEEAKALAPTHNAQFRSAGNVGRVQRFRSHVALLIPLFTRVACRGDAMVTAMEARCFQGCQGRTRMRPLALSRHDLACVALMLVILTMVFGIDCLWGGVV